MDALTDIYPDARPKPRPLAVGDFLRSGAGPLLLVACDAVALPDGRYSVAVVGASHGIRMRAVPVGESSSLTAAEAKELLAGLIGTDNWMRLSRAEAAKVLAGMEGER